MNKKYINANLQNENLLFEKKSNFLSKNKKLDYRKSKGNMSVLYWFRKALRLHDNPALVAAARTGRPLVCAFFGDAGICAHVGPARRRFLAQVSCFFFIIIKIILFSKKN